MNNNKDSDEVPLRTVLMAIIIAIIAIAVFLFPSPPKAEAPQIELAPELKIVETAEASEVVEQEKPHPFSDLAEAIIQCESSGRAHVEIIDSNGEWSRGIAQFQDRTWDWMSKEAGVTGSPLEEDKARAVLLWALENGHGKHWTCYKKVTQ